MADPARRLDLGVTTEKGRGCHRRDTLRMNGILICQAMEEGLTF
jgi:hypothetical protein